MINLYKIISSRFCLEVRSRMEAYYRRLSYSEEEIVSAVAVEAHDEWTMMDAATQARYDALAEEDQARYEREMAVYKELINEEESDSTDDE